jgi:hypothetical protein
MTNRFSRCDKFSRDVVHSLVAILGCAMAFSVSAADTSTRLILPSPNGRFEALFETMGKRGQPDQLWNALSARDVGTGETGTRRIAAGARAAGTIFEIFLPFGSDDAPDDTEAWSPDGNYLAYWDDFCIEEPNVPGGVVCHSHEIHFLRMLPVRAGDRELVLSRYEFGGWVRGQPHTVLQLDSEGHHKRRRP